LPCDAWFSDEPNVVDSKETENNKKIPLPKKTRKPLGELIKRVKKITNKERAREQCAEKEEVRERGKSNNKKRQRELITTFSQCLTSRITLLKRQRGAPYV